MESIIYKFQRRATPLPNENIHHSLKNLDVTLFFDTAIPYRLPLNTVAEFLDIFQKWIQLSTLNSIDDLSVLPTEEYPYIRGFINNWRLFNGDFNEDEALIFSAPFSATGALHADYKSIIEFACQEKIPMLIDCAFFEICTNLKLKLYHDCIKNVCFSMSKASLSGTFRAGIEFIDAVNTSYSHTKKVDLSAKICGELAKCYSYDYIFQQYRSQEPQICEEYDLTSSNAVIFGFSNSKGIISLNSMVTLIDAALANILLLKSMILSITNGTSENLNQTRS